VPPIEPSVALAPLQVKAVQDMGNAVNSGDGASLIDFGQWAVQQYPADHYALVLWDHGGGWSMIASDDTTQTSIHMPVLQDALQKITSAANVDKLDLVGFDACLMAQVPVLVTVAPYARYMVAAEELVPGFGWDYIAPLKLIAQNPDADIKDIGKAEVDAFYTLYSKTDPAAAHSFDLALLDLSKTDDVVNALGAFSDAVKASGEAEVKAIATARSNAQEFAKLGEDSSVTDATSSVDLMDFMRLMTQLSKTDAVKKAAQDVINAASEVVLYHKASASLPNAKGLSIFFPANKNFFDDAEGSRYTTEFGQSLASWQSFLETFYAAALAAHDASAATSPLSIKVTKITTGPNNVGSIYDTPVISYETNGTNIVGVEGFIILKLDSQASAIMDTFPISSSTTTEDGSHIVDYPDGPSSSDFYWDARINQLSDGTTSVPALMTTNATDDQHGFIYGEYTSLRTGDKTPANLLVDLETNEVVGAWANQQQGNAQTTAQIRIEAGDSFEPIYYLLDEKGALTQVRSGQAFKFSRNPLKVSFMPAPDGTYTINLIVRDATGAAQVASATVDVKNEGLDTAERGFKDIGMGLSFLYPWDWTDVSAFVRNDGSEELSVSDVADNVTIYVDSYAVASQDETLASAKALLGQFDGVKIGDATTGTVDGNDAAVLPYQYTDSDGQEISGAAVVVYVADNNLGYVIMLESQASQHDTANTVFNKLLESIKFFAPVGN
jgi:hypothetical protein